MHKQFYEDPDLNYTHHMYTINDENLLIQTLKFSYHEIWNEFLTTHAIPPYNIIRCATVNLDKLNMSTDYYNEAIIQIQNDILETLILNFHDTDYSIMNRWTTDEFHRIKLVTLPFPVSGQDLRMKTIQDIQNCNLKENILLVTFCSSRNSMNARLLESAEVANSLLVVSLTQTHSSVSLAHQTLQESVKTELQESSPV